MTAETRFHKAIQVISRHDIVEVLLDPKSQHHSLHALTTFNIGDTIMHFSAASIQSYPTYLTVQTGTNTHIHLKPPFLQFINHSCRPNVFFDTTAMQIICLRPIEVGDEFFFFYPSTEWKMDQPFACKCGEPTCLKTIQGAFAIVRQTLSQYRLTDFISQQLHLTQ